jgi:hypothetical protein
MGFDETVHTVMSDNACLLTVCCRRKLEPRDMRVCRSLALLVLRDEAQRVVKGYMCPNFRWWWALFRYGLFP